MWGYSLSVDNEICTLSKSFLWYNNFQNSPFHKILCLNTLTLPRPNTIFYMSMNVLIHPVVVNSVKSLSNTGTYIAKSNVASITYGLPRLFLRSNWEYAYHYHLIIYVNKTMCSPHVSTNNNCCCIVIVIGTNMWWAHGFVYINNELIIICILPVRAKEQPNGHFLRLSTCNSSHVLGF